MGVMSENLVSISDFAASRQQDRGTVAAWIRKHPEVDEGCTMVGKDNDLQIYQSCKTGKYLRKKQNAMP